METIMLTGNNPLTEEALNAKPKQTTFEQELKVSLEESNPNIQNLKVQFGGGINRDDEIGELVSLSKKRKDYDLEANQGIHHEYQTGDNFKTEFGPEDQLIEHIFTMHWSQVDKILLRAKVNAGTVPPSKRMTILEVGTDVYSKERNFITRENFGQDNEMGRKI